MASTVSLGRVAGVDVRAHWSALVLPVLIADALGESILPAAAPDASGVACWTAAVVVAVAFLASLLAHELAHAVVARRAGLPVQGITLWMLGGATVIERDAPSPEVDLRVAAAGPVAGLVAAAAAFVIGIGLNAAGAGRLAVASVQWLAITNVLLSVFNLLPAAPLDGGRVLRAVIWRRTGDGDRAAVTAARSGQVTGIAIVGLGALEMFATASLVSGLWLVLIGWFLAASATAERVTAEMRLRLAGIRVADVMDRQVAVTPTWSCVGDIARRAAEAGVHVVVVTGSQGEPVGTTMTQDLVAASFQQPSAPVAAVSKPVDARAVTSPDELLLPALRKAENDLPLVAVEHDDVVGVVTADILERAARREPAKSLQAA